MKIRTIGMVLVILGAAIGAILIVSGTLLAVTSVSTLAETVREIQINVQNHNGTYNGTYYFGVQKDTVLINVTASEFNTFLNLKQKNWNAILFWSGDVGLYDYVREVKGLRSVRALQFQLNASLPFDGDYWVEISADSGVVSANGTITQTRVVTRYPYMYDFGVKILLFGSFLMSGSFFIYSYRQVKLELEKTQQMFGGRLLASLELMSICGGFLLTLIFGLFPPLEDMHSILEPPVLRFAPFIPRHWAIQHGFPLAWLEGKWTYRTFRGYSFVWQGFIVDFMLWLLLAVAVTYFYVRRKKAHLPTTE